jgi:hypothetical protein
MAPSFEQLDPETEFEDDEEIDFTGMHKFARRIAVSATDKVQIRSQGAI